MAVKLSMSSSKGDLSPAVIKAISGRMLAHPHVVNKYLVSVMSGEEVLAAIEATARAEAGEGGSGRGDDGCVAGSSHVSAKRAALAREVDRLLGTGSGSESEPGGSGAFANEHGNSEGSLSVSADGELSAQAAEDDSYLPADLPPGESTAVSWGACPDAATWEGPSDGGDVGKRIELTTEGAEMETDVSAQAEEDAPYPPDDTPPGGSDPPPPRRPSTAYFSGPNARQLRALGELSFDQAARVMALAPEQYVTAIVVSASVE